MHELKKLLYNLNSKRHKILTYDERKENKKLYKYYVKNVQSKRILLNFYITLIHTNNEIKKMKKRIY